MHRVVLVDDVPELRQILRLILQHSGWFEVVGEGGSAEEAVALATRLQPELMVLDVEMPGGPTGWQALPRIREAAPGTRVVVLSGSPADETAPGKEALASAVLEKGLPPQELIRVLLRTVADEDAGPHQEGSHEMLSVPVTAAPHRTGLERMAAEEMAARLVALVESASDVIISKSLTGEILSWNPAAERIYGYAAEEVIGRSISLLVPPERPDEVPGILARIARGERVEHFETVRVRKDGTRVDVALTVSPVMSPDGRIIGASTVARDISARRESDAALSWAFAQLEQQNRELRRSNDELDSFASVASHDLAQPLQVAYGYLEMVQSEFGPTMDPTARQWIETASDSLERMRRLVQDILTFARTGNRELVPEPVDLSVSAEAAVANLATQIAERGATVEIGPLPTVSGSEAQLTQLLQNLIGNGLKFAPPGRDPVVRVSCVETPDHAVVHVDDNGAGVAPEQRDRIFEMFQRAHGSEVAGTGLGLATCRKIISRHGGRIWVEEAPGGGARFSVLLPKVGGSATATDFGNADDLT